MADTSEENKNIVRRFIDEVWNKGNTAAADELLDESVRLRGVSYDATREGEKAFVAGYRKAFPDMHFRITHIMAEGNQVTVQIQGKGTHKGDWQGVKASNNPVTVNGSAIYTIQGGKIVEMITNPDLIGVRRDMGALPKDMEKAEAFKRRMY